MDFHVITDRGSELILQVIDGVVITSPSAQKSLPQLDQTTLKNNDILGSEIVDARK